MDPIRQRLLTLLHELSYEEREVILASGRPSNFYIDARNTSLHPEGIVLCGQAMYQVLTAGGPEFDAVAGPSLGADPLVSGVLHQSWAQGRPVPGMLVRKEAKGHGTGRLLEGTRNVQSAARVAIVEDVLTSGGSSIRTIRAVRDAGYQPVRLLVLVDREEGGREAVESSEGVVVESIFRKRDFRPDPMGHSK